MNALGKYKRYFKYFIYRLIESIFLTLTGNWKKFYGWYLDRQDQTKNARDLRDLGQIKRKEGYDKGLYDTSMGDYHLRFMVSHGLQPSFKLFDLGFGYGRTTIPLVKFLAKDNYIGSEISKERFRIATEWLELEGLGNREPQLVVAYDNRFEFIDDYSLDFVWAQSVFTHLPETELIDILMRLKSKLKKTGCVVFNFTVSKKHESERSSIKDFSYSPEKIDQIVGCIGYTIEYLDDWQSELNEGSRATHNKMVKLTI